MQQITAPGIVDPTEAPAGFYAVSKNSVAGDGLGNICRSCDWRPECNSPQSDFTAYGHRCMESPVVTPDGREIARQDGCSVVFKLNRRGAM